MSNYDARVFSASPQAVEAIQRSLQEAVDTKKLCCGDCDFYESVEGQCLGDKRKRKVDMARSMCPVGRAQHLALKEVFDLRRLFRSIASLADSAGRRMYNR
jgi:hypothetical protein